MKRVSYIFPTSHHYRLPFHERLRDLLAQRDIDYRVIYCDPGYDSLQKKDAVEIDWGYKVPQRNLLGGMTYQYGLKHALRSDLVIVQQENKLFLNYILNALSICGCSKVAYFGHGRNFQARDRNSLLERWKRFWATKVDWWFAYTEETRSYVQSLGFSNERITVFNNSVDTTVMIEQVANSPIESRSVLRSSLGVSGSRMGVFVGGMYPDKRIGFLVAAAEHIRGRIADFELILIGGGPDLPLAKQLAENRPWLHVVGPRFGQEKIDMMLMGDIFMMPGLMGLAILDAGIAGLPIATTAFPWHSPEIAYLEPDVCGIMVGDWQSAEAYGDEVSTLLLDNERIARMSEGARDMAKRYSIESMARNFADGVMKALEV